MNFFKISIVVLLIGNSANALSYAFQFIIARNLSVEEFGVVTSIISSGALISSIFSIVPFIVARFFIKFQQEPNLQKSLLGNLLLSLSLLLLLFNVIILCFLDDLASFLKIKENVPIYIFTLAVSFGILLSFFIGLLQGLLEHVKVALIGFLVSVFRLVFILLVISFMVNTSNLVLLASLVPNLMIGSWLFIKYCKYTDLSMVRLPKDVYIDVAKSVFPLAMTSVIIAVLTNIDIVLVKHYVPAQEAGEYSVASLIAKIVVFLPSVLLAVLFPQVSKNEVDGKGSLNTLLIVLGLTFLLTTGFSSIVYIFPEVIITLLFGSKYIGTSDVLFIITFAMGFVALSSVIFNFLLAKRKYGFIYLSLIFIALTGWMVFVDMHSNSLQIAMAILYGCIGLFISSLLLLVYYWLPSLKKTKNI